MPKNLSISARWWQKVDVRSADECWPWLASRDSDGYGRFQHPTVNGHRYSCAVRVDKWRTGVVLDPFAGSGTTLQAAQNVGRHATGIDIDPRNAALAQQRVGMFLEVDA